MTTGGAVLEMLEIAGLFLGSTVIALVALLAVVRNLQERAMRPKRVLVQETPEALPDAGPVDPDSPAGRRARRQARLAALRQRAQDEGVEAGSPEAEALQAELAAAEAEEAADAAAPAEAPAASPAPAAADAPTPAPAPAAQAPAPAAAAPAPPAPAPAPAAPAPDAPAPAPAPAPEAPQPPAPAAAPPAAVQPAAPPATTPQPPAPAPPPPAAPAPASPPSAAPAPAAMPRPRGRARTRGLPPPRPPAPAPQPAQAPGGYGAAPAATGSGPHPPAGAAAPPAPPPAAPPPTPAPAPAGRAVLGIDPTKADAADAGPQRHGVTPAGEMTPDQIRRLNPRARRAAMRKQSQQPLPDLDAIPADLKAEVIDLLGQGKQIKAFGVFRKRLEVGFKDAEKGVALVAHEAGLDLG